jgi:hypothetical protein
VFLTSRASLSNSPDSTSVPPVQTARAMAGASAISGRARMLAMISS